jgi:hypothetical protein
LRAVVIGRSVAERFPQVKQLAGLEERFLIDEGPDTMVWLIERGIDSVQYYGGLEEGRRFAAAAQRALISVEQRLANAPTFLAGLEEILTLAGIPSDVVSAGLEQFSRELDALAGQV